MYTCLCFISLVVRVVAYNQCLIIRDSQRTPSKKARYCSFVLFAVPLEFELVEARTVQKPSGTKHESRASQLVLAKRNTEPCAIRSEATWGQQVPIGGTLRRHRSMRPATGRSTRWQPWSSPLPARRTPPERHILQAGCLSTERPPDSTLDLLQRFSKSLVLCMCLIKCRTVS